MATTQKDLVRSFWDEQPCCDRLASAERGTPEYFVAIEAAKDRLEPFVYEVAEFARVEIRTLATAYDRRVAGPLADLLPSAGWFHCIRARR